MSRKFMILRVHFVIYGHQRYFKFLQIECNFRTLKTSRENMNHEMYSQVHTIFIDYVLNKVVPSLCFHSNFRFALYN